MDSATPNVLDAATSLDVISASSVSSASSSSSSSVKVSPDALPSAAPITTATVTTPVRVTRSTVRSLNSSRSSISSTSSAAASALLSTSPAMEEVTHTPAVLPKERNRQQRRHEVEHSLEEETPRRRSLRLRRRQSRSPIDPTVESEADASFDNPPSPSSSLSSTSTTAASSTTAEKPNARLTKRGASSPNSSSSMATDAAEGPSSKKKPRSKSPVSSLSPSEIVDLPFDDASDRRKINLISQYLQSHPCLFEKTLALSSLHRLHSKICRRFKRAITHVSLLNGRIRATGVRYKKASDANRRSARYVLRMRLAVLEGVRTCFCEYAQEKAEILKDIEQIFVREHSQLSDRGSVSLNFFPDPIDGVDDADLEEDEEAQEEEEEED